MKPWQVLTALALVGLIALFASGIGRDPRYIPPALLGQADAQHRPVELQVEVRGCPTRRGPFHAALLYIFDPALSRAPRPSLYIAGGSSWSLASPDARRFFL